MPCTPGERLKKLRKERNMTQEELADEVSKLQVGARQCSEKSISMLENGRLMSRKYAHLFAQVFNVDEDFILCESDHPTAADAFAEAVKEMNKEGELLHKGLFAFALLNGYAISAKPITGSPEQIFAVLRSRYQIEKDGKSIFLSIEEMNDLENELCEMVEIRLRHLFGEHEKLGKTVEQTRKRGQNDGQH